MSRGGEFWLFLNNFGESWGVNAEIVED